MSSPRPQRQLGLVSATTLVVANMIGVGVFTTSGFSLGVLKSPWIVMMAWLIGGILSALGALSYGALARRIPESGGEYIFLSRTIHPFAGMIAGWVSLLVGFSAPLALAAFGFGEYLKVWFPGIAPKWIGTILILVFTGLHALHVQRGAFVQNLAVIVKIALIALFILLAGARLDPPPSVAPPDFSLTVFAISLMWISFSYSGWNAAIYIGGEVRDPERNLPRSLLLGTGIVTLLYLAINAIFVFAAPIEDLAFKPEVGQIAALALGGKSWMNAITLLVALGLMTSVSSMVMAGPRVYAQMAKDGYLPRWLAFTEGPPRTAIFFQTIVVLIFLWSSTFEALLTFTGFMLSISTAATVLGLIRLRLKEGSTFHVPGWPWVPALFFFGVVLFAILAVIERTLPAFKALLESMN